MTNGTRRKSVQISFPTKEKKKHMRYLVILSILLATQACSSDKQREAKSPNLLFIMTWATAILHRITRPLQSMILIPGLSGW